MEAVHRDEGMAGDGLLLPAAYARDDESPDDQFYVAPRRVVHIDEGAIRALGRLYAEVLPVGGRLLDLMSSWRSHLPEGLVSREVVGLGLNAEEMADNPQLTSSIVHDVNRDPRLPFGNEEFDGAMCAVSIQYVTHPLLVFRELRRVLRPGAPFVVSPTVASPPRPSPSGSAPLTSSTWSSSAPTSRPPPGGWT